MFLSISTTHQPATDLGYLLHKHPSKLHSKASSQGTNYCFFSEITEQRCTACLVMDIELDHHSKNKQASDTPLNYNPYVNDRPFLASSLMSVAIAEFFGTAMNGRSKERQALADTAIPLEVHIAVLPCQEGAEFIRKLFEPLGYQVIAEPIMLDSQYPEWGHSHYFNLTLKGTKKISELLRQLYILIPVCDNFKHYWIDLDEQAKLIRLGEGWLQSHPMVNIITYRALKNIKSLSQQALEQLLINETDAQLAIPQTADNKIATNNNNATNTDTAANNNNATNNAAHNNTATKSPAKPIRLNEQRLQMVAEELIKLGAKSVIDLGCGEGNFIEVLKSNSNLKTIKGMDVSIQALERAAARFKDTSRISLIHGSLNYTDARTRGFEACVLIEVIEHFEPIRIPEVEQNIFSYIRAPIVLVTTPNKDFNSNYPSEGLRHDDHRFEWTRAEFQNWCEHISTKFGYQFKISFIGDVDSALGAPTQMGVFTL